MNRLTEYIKKAANAVLPRRLIFWLRCLPPSNLDFTGFNKSQKKVFIMLAADYGNLGDVAITYTQREWLEAHLEGYKTISIPLSQTYRSMWDLKKIISPEDIITLVGGGNMGDMYEGIEEQRRFVISRFKNNKIISFPQTLDFSSTKKGKISLQRTKKVYDAHNNIVLVARERASFNKMKETFKAQVLLAPDIVLSLDRPTDRQNRLSGKVLLCLRNDEEASVTAGQRRLLYDFFDGRYINIMERDTHLGEVTISEQEGELELESIWHEFQSAELVVTDRLHGMIFCAITGTPCVAMNNTNGKVAGVYDIWLKECNYITFIEEVDPNLIDSAIKKYSSADFKNNHSSINFDFSALKNIIISETD